MNSLLDIQLKLIISKGEAAGEVLREAIENAEKTLNEISGRIEKAQDELYRREDRSVRKVARI